MIAWNQYGKTFFRRPLRQLTATICLVGAALNVLHAQDKAIRNAGGAREPRLIRYNGVLPLESNKLGGPVTLHFSLYTSETANEELWGEDQVVTIDAEGRYHVLLGSTLAEGIPQGPFQNAQASWLGVGILGSDTKLPRIKLVSVPYAVAAEDARTLGGRLPSEFALKSDLAPANLVTSAAAKADMEARYSPDYLFSDLITKWPGAEDQKIRQGQGTELQVNRFQGIRFADQFPTIQSAIDDLPDSGGMIIIPIGTYDLAAPLNPGTKAVILQGQGWRSTASAAPFGYNWASRVSGTILRTVGNSDGIVIGDNAHYNGRLVVRDLFILGPGTGTSVGFYKKNPAYYGLSVFFQNVGIANFHTNMKFENLLYSTFDNMLIGGGEIGIHVPATPDGNSSNSNSFRDIRFGGNTTAMQIEGGQGWTWEGRNAVEGNTRGLLFKAHPTIPQTVAMIHRGFWFEANTEWDIKIDATENSISGIEFHDGRCSNVGNKIQIVGTGAYAANALVFSGMDCAGVDLTIPPFSSYAQVIGGRFASYTDNGKNTVKIGGSPSTAADIRLGSDRPIVGPAGQAFISGNTAGWVRQGYYGTSVTKRHDLRAGAFNFYTTDDVLRMSIVAGANLHYNGQDLRFYSDNGAALTAQIFGATGNITSNGRANFNKGVCHNSAQTVCDTAGTGAPAYPCVTGSTYRRMDGSVTATLYVCESSIWTAVGASTGQTANNTIQLVQTFSVGIQVTKGALQCFRPNEQGVVSDCDGLATNFIGVATSSTNTNPVIIQHSGIAEVLFEAAASPFAGWYACSSAGSGGTVMVQPDLCASGRQVGIVAQGGTSLTSGKVLLQVR